MSKQHQADLILKLYDLRREATMREARNWFFVNFHPQSADDVSAAMMGENGAYYRMVTGYWEMAAGLVNYGAIDAELFDSVNGEHIVVFSKLEPFLNEMRNTWGPKYMAGLEKLIEEAPNGKERVEGMRSRLAAMRAASQTKTASA